jgi:glucose-1-phosphate cytidylyltransferase
MKIVILCGGFGTRLGKETLLKPKPMVEIGNKPILWHIMKRFENYGFNDFYLALGYKSEIIKDYFLNYKSTVNDVQIDLISNKVRYKTSVEEKWIVNLIETGYNTMTGGRLFSNFNINVSRI